MSDIKYGANIEQTVIVNAHSGKVILVKRKRLVYNTSTCNFALKKVEKIWNV